MMNKSQREDEIQQGYLERRHGMVSQFLMYFKDKIQIFCECESKTWKGLKEENTWKACMYMCTQPEEIFVRGKSLWLQGG